MRTPRKAGASKGLGRADGIEHHHHDNDVLRSACGRDAEATAYANILNGGVRISAGVCGQHMPTDDSAALDMIDVGLNAIARVVNEGAEEVEHG